ncbi:MAG: hypothetical protein AB8B91_00275 [Rubripirellula sp.]
MRIAAWIGILTMACASGCASARRGAQIQLPPPPVVLSDMPTMEQVVAVVNRTQNVRQLSSNSTEVEVLSMNVPRLSATLNLEREKKLRLRAGIPMLLGAGMDLGSNDETFWFEVPEGVGMSKTMYYARHDQYREQLNRAIFPVDPTWVMDALGLVQINPANVVDGPVKRPDGKLELRDTMMMPDGMYQRVCFVEPSAGYVTDQFLYAPNGVEVARSLASDHRYYNETQCALPHTVELTLKPAGGQPLSLRIKVGTYAVNQLLSGDPNLFTMPSSGAKAVDLTKLSAPASLAPTAPVNYSATAPSAYPIRGTLR